MPLPHSGITLKKIQTITFLSMAVLAHPVLNAHAETFPSITHEQKTTQTEKIYQDAILQARAGHLDASIEEMRQLVEQNPTRQDMLGDYAVLLVWAGQYAKALTFIDRIDQPNAPGYVLEHLANAARHEKQFALAKSLNTQSLNRFPDRLEPQINQVYILTDEQQLTEASKAAEQLRNKNPERLDVIEAYAYVMAAKRDYFAELKAFDTLLALQPNHAAALKGKIKALSNLGTPQLALELADRHPGLITASEREAIRANTTAFRIRWAANIAENGLGEARFKEIDLALAESEAVAKRALNPANSLSSSERQLVLDRISALTVRYRMNDAIVLYNAMAKRPEPMPAYTKSAVASAHLELRQPELARDLYREALTSDPKNLNANMGLFFALAESEEHAAALKQINHTLAMTPEKINAWSAETIRANPDYLPVLSAQAMAANYANNPGKSYMRLRQLVEGAPYNMDVHTNYASTMRARGWPRQAEQELSWVLQAEPNHTGALGERAGALLEMQDYRNAESALKLAKSVNAQDVRVVRSEQLITANNLRELVSEGTYGRSTSRSNGGVTPRGTQDYVVDTKLFSSPINYNYRAYTHLYTAHADFEDGKARRDRAGVGVEYRSPLMTASMELMQDVNQSKTNAGVSIAFTPNDFWTFVGEYESSANQTPLQAVIADIDASRYSAEVIWQAHESRSAALGYERMDFSDGNQRSTTEAQWTERLYAGPVYQLEATVELSASHNSLRDRPYFNPSNDFSTTLQIANEWLQWRRYTRDFRHRLVATLGEYQQQGFGSKPLYDLRYEQEWNANDRLTFRYGLGRSQHPYDGVQTAVNYGYFFLNWKF